MADKRPKAMDVARSGAAQLAELIGRVPEGVLGVERAHNGDGDGDGWTVTLEVLELRRVPNSTDLLGCYVVQLDDDGDLVGYKRTRRYMRGQADEDGQ